VRKCGNYIDKNNRMNTQQQMEERLWDYIDGLSSPAERSALEEWMAANMEWQRKYRELLDVHQLMNGSELEEPSMRFTKNVMEEIARHQVAPATKTYINKNIIRSIGAFFLTLIAGFLTYCLVQFKWSSPDSASGPSQMASSYHTELEKFNWAKVLNGPYAVIFFLVTVVLGLMLLDMYLQRKKEQTGHTGR
jgi:hypothetical protein